MSPPRYTKVMNRIKKGWRKVPDKPRRLLVLLLGLLLIVLAGVIGALPGPGGIIIFLLAITVLASEFSWAMDFRDLMLKWLKLAGDYTRRHPIFVSLLAIVS